MTVAKYPYLIVGGAPKAGTTSLYKWLAAHHQVCVSSIKETRFFLDADYPLPRPKRFTGSNLEEYDGFFRHCGSNGFFLRVDATPDYLYSKTALLVSTLLPKAKIVFVLRDPVERIVSWYRFGRQKGLIARETLFEDYVKEQLRKPITNNTPIHLRALDQSRYQKYLPPFRKAFGERLMIIDFEDLKSDPEQVMAELCAFAGIDGTFYENYKFQVENVSRSAPVGRLARTYDWVRRRIAYAFHDSRFIMLALRKPNQVIRKLFALNGEQSEKIQISPEIETLIRLELKVEDRPDMRPKQLRGSGRH